VVRGAWRCVMPARRSGAKFRLAACDALTGGLATSVSCIGVIRDHSRL